MNSLRFLWKNKSSFNNVSQFFHIQLVYYPLHVHFPILFHSCVAMLTSPPQTKVDLLRKQVKLSPALPTIHNSNVLVVPKKQGSTNTVFKIKVWYRFFCNEPTNWCLIFFKYDHNKYCFFRELYSGQGGRADEASFYIKGGCSLLNLLLKRDTSYPS